MGLLVSEALFPITVKYVELKTKDGREIVHVINDEKEEKKYENRIKKMQTQWRQPGFTETNDLIRQSVVYDHFRGEREVDMYLFRSLTIQNCLKAWDLIDEKGEAIPCTQDNISKLDPQVALYLVEQFNLRNIPTEEELKN